MVADIANLGSQSAGYYLAEVATDELGVFQAERYYSGHGEAPGYWGGAAAARLGLQGTVQPEQFRALFDGKNPATGELLGRAHARNGRPAFDLVLRPVKSVSVVWALGNNHVQRTVEAIHRASVADAMLDLEDEVGTRRGAGGKTRIAGQGLLAAVYDHRQSRAGDPLLHSHVIIANRIQGVDGKWTTLDGHDLYHEAMGADATYEVLMRGRLREALGVEWERNERTGQWEIAGVPDELLQQFSQRRAEIELAKESREAKGEGWSPKVGQYVAHATRPDKERVDEQTLRGRWAATADGFDVSAVTGQSAGQRTVDRQALFGQLAGPDGVTRDKATFDRRDVRDAVRRSGHEATSRAAWTELSADFVRDPRVVPILQDGKPLWSTVDLQTCERSLVSGAEARRNENVTVVEPGLVRAALAAARPTLGDDQAAMVRAVTGDGAGVSVAVGRAGTGKTTALGVARDAWSRQGVEVRGAAPTGIAATQLEQSAGVPTSTVDSLLLGLDAKRDELPAGGVLVVDEAGMIGTRKLARLLEHAEQAGTKVVVVGDERQLQAIEAGGGFKALRQRLGATELTENRRQRSELDRQALELVRQGKGEEALAVYGAGGRITWAKDQGTADAAMLKDWWASFRQGDNAVMLTYLRGDADRLNAAAREFRRAAGHLGDQELDVKGRRFAVGDLVVCRKNDRRQTGVVNGQRARVEALDLQGGTMLVKREDGSHVTLTAVYLAKDGTGGGPSVAHAYATTTHKTQAMTVDRAFLRAGGSMTSEWSYVALSRVRQAAHIYGVQPEIETADGIEKYGARPTSRDQVQAGMSRSEVEDLGVEQHAGGALRHMSVGQLRAERDRLASQLGTGPRSKVSEHRLLKEKRDQAEEAYRRDPSGLNRKAADRAEERFRPVDEHERRRAGWDERMASVRVRARTVMVELGLRAQMGVRALEVDPPQHLVDELGRPTVEWTAPAREAWGRAADAIESYRDRFKAYGDRALGDAPKDFGQRRAWNQAAGLVAGTKGGIADMFEKAAEATGKTVDKGQEARQAVLERIVELGLDRRS
jgi:conjugative relaxase-like TrwC/TraI family protein